MRKHTSNVGRSVLGLNVLVILIFFFKSSGPGMFSCQTLMSSEKCEPHWASCFCIVAVLEAHQDMGRHKKGRRTIVVSQVYVVIPVSLGPCVGALQ